MSEECAAAGIARRRSTPLHPQILVSREGARMSPRRSPRLQPQIHATMEGAGMARRIRPRRRTLPAKPASLPDDDDMLREILLRLPPQPSSLPRASAVCKRWRGLVADPRFLRHFRAHHRKPPLLGFFERSYMGFVFTPILGPPDRIPLVGFSLGRYSSCPFYDLLDCRHGLVLINVVLRHEIVVCEPITGEQRCVAIPSELLAGYIGGAVLSAAGDHGYVHGGCHLSSYKVVLVSTGRSDMNCLACVYSSQTGIWSNLISAEAPYKLFLDDHVPATLVGNCLYWSTDDGMLEFDLDRHNLAVIMDPGPHIRHRIYHRRIIQAADGTVGYAILLYPRLQMWQRNINGHGVATWVLWKTIELCTVFRFSSPIMGIFVRLLWCDEDVVVLGHNESVYIVQLKSMQSRKLNEIHSTGNDYFPFKSFITPGRAIAGGFNGAEMLHIG